MKFRQDFDVAETLAVVWAFFDAPERVAACIPGIESVTVLDADTLAVRVTQKVGPLSATFESKVHITERVREERIQFTSTGKAVRGAIGNFRTTNTVSLQAVGDQTHVVVEGEAALAGVLGSIGQKVIVKQADKVTAEFAANLAQRLSGTIADPSSARSAGPQEVARPVLAPRSGSGVASSAAIAGRAADHARDPWVKVAALLSGLAVLLELIILWRGGLHP